MDLRKLLSSIQGTLFHPQWLSDRFHIQSKRVLLGLRDNCILDVGSGNASYKSLIHPSNHYIDLDYPSTNDNINDYSKRAGYF